MSLAQGEENFSLISRLNCLFEQEVGSLTLEGHIGLPALQPLPCPSGSCVDREGHRCKYTRLIGCCVIDAMQLPHVLLFISGL